MATTDDARTLRSKDLVGAVLDVVFQEKPALVRIGAVERDPRDKTGTIWLHTIEVRQSGGGWENPCSADREGRRQGFPLGNSPGGLDFTCTGGAIGECVRLGYWPWAKGRDGKSLEPVRDAWSRLVRADYGGDDEVNTQDNLAFDIADTVGIRSFAAESAGKVFEAGWVPDGAVCLHHPRAKDMSSMAELVQRNPQLRGRSGAACTEEFARSKGALIFSRSKP